MSDPFFTVIIPTHKRPQRLRDAVGSVLRQTYRDFELIVIDDDPRASGILALADIHNNRLRTIRNDREPGANGARNAGIIRARGEWIAFLDDDDQWLPPKLIRQFNLIQQSPIDVNLIYTGTLKYNAKTGAVHPSPQKEQAGNVRRKLLHHNFISGLSTVAVRTRDAQAIGGFDERFPAMQDIDFYIRMAGRGSIRALSEPLAWIQTTADGRITQNPTARFEASKLLWEKYRPEINADSWLRDRAIARVFGHAIGSGNIGAALRYLPAMILAAIRSPGNAREAGSLAIQGRRSRR